MGGGRKHVVEFKRDRKNMHLSGPVTVGELFLPKPSFSPWRSSLWVSTHPAYAAVSLTIERAYLADREPVCNFGHIFRQQWGLWQVRDVASKGAVGKHPVPEQKGFGPN